MKDKIIEIINFSCEHFVAIPLKCKKRLADELLALFDSETKEQNQVIEILKGHVDDLQEQIAKRDELINKLKAEIE
jgi:phage shock protein A